MTVTSEMADGTSVVRARSLQEWRDWLDDNGEHASKVWLIVYKKGTGQDSVRFRDAVEHALCFGWVDSKAVKRDGDSCYLLFHPRNPKSSWGRANRERAERLTRAGYMRPAGQRVIDEAKASGKWDEFADAQNLIVPDDLQAALEANEPALTHFSAFPPSSRRLILQWIASAKKAETRERRIAQTVELAAQNIRANHPK
ncbi:MAG: YdeI/OmpD-associated family protein [Actinomycetaceae bacterium]|nr:YdeI/OmpD-associated family protein [Actinomycetaceae bacterium]